MNMQNLSDRLASVLSITGVSFVFKGSDISYEQVLSARGLLPAIAKRADQLSSLCLGYGLGVSFNEVDRSMLGKEVTFDDSAPLVIVMLMIYDVVNEIKRGVPEGAKVKLDELLYD